MSFKNIALFLPAAFERIDKTHVQESTQTAERIKDVFRDTVPQIEDITIIQRESALVVFTHSQIAKHLIYLNKQSIISSVNARFSHIKISDIQFKGPR